MRAQTKPYDKSRQRPPREPDILLVDADPVARALAQAILARHGHAVKLAPSALHALQALKRQSFRLVLAEQRMQGGMDGLGLLAHVRSRFPACRRVLMMKRPTGELVMQARILADARVLIRPCPPEKIVAVVTEELSFGG